MKLNHCNNTEELLSFQVNDYFVKRNMSQNPQNMIDSIRKFVEQRKDKLTHYLDEDRKDPEIRADEYRLKAFDGTIYQDPNFSRRGGNQSRESKGINKSNTSDSRMEEVADPEVQKEELMNKIKVKLETFEKENDYFKEKKRRFNDILVDLEKDSKDLDKKDRRKDKNEERSERKERKEQIKAVDQEITRKNQIEIKQRVASYSMKAFDILDLKKVVKFWKGKFLYLWV
jgi:hypothetical protein